MIQDPEPIDPVKHGSYKITLRGEPVEIDPQDIPALFVACVAAERAEYYAGVDAAKGHDFQTVFDEEMRHALRDPYEIKDWMANNMDLPTPTKDEVGAIYSLSNATEHTRHENQ